MEDAKQLKTPLMISEFGACSNSTVCEREITQVLDACDQTLSGWAYWQFKQNKDSTTVGVNFAQGFYDLDGQVQWLKVRALSRPYQRKTQGYLTEMKFDIQTSKFESIFYYDSLSTHAITEIFINKHLWYDEQGFNIRIFEAEFPHRPVFAEVVRL